MTEVIQTENEYWDVNKKIVVDNSTAGFNYYYINEDTNYYPSTATLYTFQTKNVDSYYIPAESYVRCTIGISGVGGAALPANAMVALINDGANLFDNATLYINDIMVEQKLMGMGYGSTVLKLVDYTPDYSDSVATSEWWYPDSGCISGAAGAAQSFSSIASGTAGGNGNPLEYTVVGGDMTGQLDYSYNPGFRKRLELSTNNIQGNNNVISFDLPLKRVFGFLRDNNTVMVGTRISFRLNTNFGDQRLVQIASGAGGAPGSNASTGYTPPDNYPTAGIGVARNATAFPVIAGVPTITMLGMKWWIPVAVPSVETATRLFATLEKPIALHWRDWQCFIYNGQTAATNSWRITQLANKPVNIYVMFQRNLRLTQVVNATPACLVSYNPGVYDNLQATNLQIQMNNKLYPDVIYQEAWNYEGYHRLFNSLSGASGRNVPSNTVEGGIINYKNFADCYPIYRFDVSKVEASIFQTAGVSDITLNYTLLQPPPPAEGYRIITVIEAERASELTVANGRMIITV